jgi:hypothetical protein
MYLQPSANVFIEGRKCQLEENSLFKYIAVETLSCSKSTDLRHRSNTGIQTVYAKVKIFRNMQ